MKGLVTVLLLCLPLSCLMTGSLMAETTADKSGEHKAEKSPDLVQMENLAEAGILEALKAVQRSGSFYPFAMGLRGVSEQLQLVGYQGEPEARPSVDDFAVALFLQLREMAKRDKDLVAAVVLKPFHATAEDGSKVPGIWVAADHRSEKPWVMFQPLIMRSPGTYVLGQIIYQPSEESIFTETP